MSQNNLPQRAEQPESPAPVANKMFIASGTGLLLGGMSIAIFGLGLFSVLALVGGFLGLLATALLRKSLEATSGQTVITDQGKELERQIKKAKYFENVGDLGERTAAQMEEAAERIAKFRALLGLKFDPSELTYGRYLGTAEAAFFSIRDNLHLVGVSLQSLAVADVSNIPADRKALREAQFEKVRQLLSLNESAITELERVSGALAEIQTRRGEGSSSLDSVMEQLKELADRAKKYSVQSVETKEK